MGVFSTNDLWPNQIVPYERNSSHPYWNMIYAAICEINERTNVTMVERRSGQSGGYIYFTCDSSKSNFASLGYRGDEAHQVNIKHGMRVLHELGHILGMVHEHQRPDRDNYIEFLMHNINDRDIIYESSLKDKESYDDLRKPLPDYDIHSCMHYWCTACTKDDNVMVGAFAGMFGSFTDPNFVYDHGRFCGALRTMSYKPNRSLAFFTPERLSPGDIESINRYYPIAKPQKPAPPVTVVRNDAIISIPANDSWVHFSSSSDVGKLGISKIKVVPGGFFFKFRFYIENTRSGSFRFYDESGDYYDLSCQRDGEHYVDYNSSAPKLVKVVRK
jgi:hypothetical protein